MLTSAQQASAATKREEDRAASANADLQDDGEGDDEQGEEEEAVDDKDVD